MKLPSIAKPHGPHGLFLPILTGSHSLAKVMPNSATRDPFQLGTLSMQGCALSLSWDSTPSQPSYRYFSHVFIHVSVLQLNHELGE